MASLKVWHWFENPLAVEDNFVNLFLLNDSDNIYITYIEPTNWGIPAALFTMNPPTECIGLLRVCLKKSDNSEHFFLSSFKYNSTALEPQNVSMHIPFAFNHATSSDIRTFILIANGSIILDHGNKNFQVRITEQQFYHAFTSMWVTVTGNSPAIRAATVQGINIYY